MKDGKGNGKAKENLEQVVAHDARENFEYISHDEAGPSTGVVIPPDSPQDDETRNVVKSPTKPLIPTTSPNKQHYEALAFKAVREGNANALKALLGSPAYVFEKTRETQAAIELATAKLAVAEAMIECLREQNPIILQEQREKGQEIPQEKRQQVVAGIRKKLQDIIEKIVQARTPEIMGRYAAFSEERLKHWDVNPAEQIELLRLFLKEQFQEDILKSFLESLMRGGKKAPAWGELFQDIQTHYKNEAKERQDELQKLQTTLQSEARAAERKYIEETAQWSLTDEVMPFLDVAQEEIFEFAEENNQDQPGPSQRRGLWCNFVIRLKKSIVA